MGKPIGYIKDVNASIKQGVTHFKNQLARAKGDIKLVLQSYNFGGGFIDYCMKKGGKYTYELAYSFSESMVKKVGRISRIPPGYGDSKYVERVLRYYDGNLPAGACKGGGAVGEGSGGASSCPVVTGREGKSKYHLGSGGSPDIIDLHNLPGRNFGLTIVGGGGTSKVRKATGELLIEVAKLYKAATGDSFNITSGWRPGDNQWHGTGWAADIDTPNTMRVINGKMRFPNGTDKEKARKLVECCLKAGFRGLVFGDWDIIQEMNGKYGDGAMQYDPKGHWNHLHCSYPLCKK
ncbi:lysozyme family protein [Bacillus thuringiensis]|uniref:lysozyme family protein n=1 Tax=Bacillus thuringiensis TaxID=1428 RepID=UPI0024BC1C4F|nr:lysozyme family protein [Bacillus thuringiensis]